MKIIDRILKEVCLWPESDISREDHTDRGYIDYVLTHLGRRAIAVEAKHDGTATRPAKGRGSENLLSEWLDDDRQANTRSGKPGPRIL